VPILAAIVVCTAVADAASGVVVKQEGACDRPVTPASTFKIALSLMGYDSGYLVDEHLPALPFHEGYVAWDPSWKATTDPTSWIRNSVVWYSQQLTEWLGDDRFRRYVTAFRYGNQDVSGGLTKAWLSSSLRISPLEQLAFLEKVVERRLPVNAHAYDMTSRILSLGTLANGWSVHGKPGTGTAPSGRACGWFVGWAEKGGKRFVFARLIEDEKPETVRAGLRAREAFLRELPALLDGL
jgi:beta-lactamase class D